MLRASRLACSRLVKAWQGGLRRRTNESHFSAESSERLPGKWDELKDLALNRKRLDPNDPFHSFLLFHFRARICCAIVLCICAMFTWPEHSLIARTILKWWNGDKRDPASTEPAAILPDEADNMKHK